MSIWGDIHKRANGLQEKKEDQVIPEEPQENDWGWYGIPDHPSKWNYDSGSEIFKKYVTDLDDLLGKFKSDLFKF